MVIACALSVGLDSKEALLLDKKKSAVMAYTYNNRYTNFYCNTLELNGVSAYVYRW